MGTAVVGGDNSKMSLAKDGLCAGEAGRPPSPGSHVTGEGSEQRACTLESDPWLCHLLLGRSLPLSDPRLLICKVERMTAPASEDLCEDSEG